MKRWLLRKFIGRDCVTNCLLALAVIPLGDKGSWVLEKYSRIPGHQVQFVGSSLEIKVRSSAGPLTYRSKEKTRVWGFKIKGEFIGLPQFKDIKKQGDKGADDYPLRVGFVVPGEKRLNAWQRLIAANWVKRFYESIPTDMGLERIEFYNVTQNLEQVGSRRIHPLSDLISENFFASVQHTGKFEYEYRLPQPIEAVALWIGVDGDDTKSEFTVRLDALEIDVGTAKSVD